MTWRIITFWVIYTAGTLVVAGLRGETFDGLLSIACGYFCVWAFLGSPLTARQQELVAWGNLRRISRADLLIGALVAVVVGTISIGVVLILRNGGGFWASKLGGYVILHVGAAIGMLSVWGSAESRDPEAKA